jgi:ubiquinone/menaquinone biosynthesis C-methylase UbiE
MSTAPAPQPSEAERWAGEMGEKWNTHFDRFEGLIAPLGKALIDAAKFQPGERVIDVGCGAGATTIEIARRVGPKGAVVGLDISPTLVRTAQGRAAAQGVENVSFVVGDASEAGVGEAGFDRLFSRFGIMFFEEPYVAFAHLHGFMKPGGRMIVSCWGPQPENPWIVEVAGVVSKYVEMPRPDPRAPGPFAFGDMDYFRDILTKAGFKDVRFTPWRGEQTIGGPGSDAKSATQFLTETLFVGEMLKNLPEARKQEALVELEALLKSHEKDGDVRMGGMAWLVGAKA